MTADALRDRIARALHDEGAHCGNCGYEDFDQHGCLDCQQALSGYADAVLRVLADADPTDLGFKWVDGITYCTFHDATVTAERARAGACDRAHHFCAEVPVYARPLPGGDPVTADALRDRIARALHDEGAYCGTCGYEGAFDQHGCLDCQQTLYGYADAVLAVLADADPTDIGGRTLTQIQMLEKQRDAMLRRTFELAEQIAAVRAELPAVLDLLRAVVERCVPTVLDAQTRPTDDLWALVWHRLGNARPRTKETTNE